MKRITRIFALFVFASVASNSFPLYGADPNVFENIELIRQSGDSVRETSVKIEFGETSMLVISRSTGDVLRDLPYAQIKSAEYSYSKNPRWKTGLGLGAAAFLFPPLLFIAIPVGFSKHRRHWVTVRTDSDYAVLKVSKKIRKLFMPAFE
ncbi:MAG TPA: hypothetical protein VGQ55_10875, partial [Pyrinomonadaceae bacterium]|nr:hypothetical protein [Pyrinomonadaceae bacterium]